MQNWRVERRFQVRRAPDAETLARARTDYVCINLDSGRACRMPDSFSRAYIQPGTARPEQVDDGQQDDRSQQRYTQSARLMSPWLMVAAPTSGLISQPPINAPTMPHHEFRRMPSCVRMITLASHPIDATPKSAR